MAKKKNVPAKSDLNGNDTKTLDFYDSIVENWACNKYKFKDERQKRFAHYLALGMRPYPAALKAGYSETYAKSGVYKLFGGDKKFEKKIQGISKNFRDTYPEFCANMLVDISFVERKIVEKLVDDPESLDAVKSKVLRDIKRSAGVLAEESRPVQFIPVNVAIQIQQVVDGQQAPKQIEAEEIVDVEDK